MGKKRVAVATIVRSNGLNLCFEGLVGIVDDLLAPVDEFRDERQGRVDVPMTRNTETDYPGHRAMLG